MDRIRQEKLNLGPTFEEIWHTHPQIYDLQDLEKINSEAFP